MKGEFIEYNTPAKLAASIINERNLWGMYSIEDAIIYLIDLHSLNFLSVLEENYNAAKDGDAETHGTDAVKAVKQEYEDLISIYKSKQAKIAELLK